MPECIITAYDPGKVSNSTQLYINEDKQICLLKTYEFSHLVQPKFYDLADKHKQIIIGTVEKAIPQIQIMEDINCVGYPSSLKPLLQACGVITYTISSKKADDINKHTANHYLKVNPQIWIPQMKKHLQIKVDKPTKKTYVINLINFIKDYEYSTSKSFHSHVHEWNIDSVMLALWTHLNYNGSNVLFTRDILAE